MSVIGLRLAERILDFGYDSCLAISALWIVNLLDRLSDRPLDCHENHIV